MPALSATRGALAAAPGALTPLGAGALPAAVL